MKENNKFSLSAFFCSLGSKSKIFMFFLLGAPFLLVQIFTLKVYANSAVVPVVPEGLTSSGITSNGIVPGDPSLLYYTVLISLGLKADEVYQVNKADIVDSTIESLNEFDSVNDPTLGNDLESYLEWVDNAKSQNGYVNELSIPRPLWNRLNKATSNGLNIKISNPGGAIVFHSATDIYNLFRDYGYTGSLVNAFNQIFDFYSVTGEYVFSSYTANGNATEISLSAGVNFENGYYIPINGSYQYLTVNLNNPSAVIYGAYGANYNTNSVPDFQVIASSQSSTSNKSIGVARPFITSKANNTYDVLSKSGVINDSTGDLEGDVTMSVLSPDRLKDIASDYEDVATDIPVFFPDSRLVPIDIENPNEIPDSVGIPGDTPQEIIDSLADTIDPSPAEPIVIQPFNYIDQWDPFIPDPTPETPLVGLSAVMNWLAEQMQTTMYLTQFSNCWLVLSTLVVAACLIGLVRIWR